MRSEVSRCKYIDSGQITVMITIFAVLYCVSQAVYADCGAMLANTAASSVILAVMAIPLAALTCRREGSVLSLAADKNKWAGRIIAAMYLIYFLSAAADLLRGYGVFVSERFFEEGGSLLCVILTGLVCIYISWAGLQAVCRMSTVILYLLIFTSLVFIAFALGDFTMPEIRLHRIGFSAESLSGIFPVLAAVLAAMCIISGGAGRRTRKGIYAGLAAGLAAAAAIIAAIFSVLGDFTRISEYPLLDSVIYASREASFRLDGLFFSLWTLIAAAAVSLLCACAGEALKTIIPPVRCEGIYTAGAAIIMAAVGTFAGSDIIAAVYKSPYSSVILLSLIPLTVLISVGKGKENAA